MSETTKEEQTLEEVAAIQSQTGFIGHPKGVGILSFMQLCWSFAKYGMSSILIFYLYKQAPDGLGFDQNSASQLISLYFAVYPVCGVVGSYVADRIMGARRALLISRITEAVAYICLAVPFFGMGGYAASQLLLCVAAMMAGRSAETLIGKMYAKEDGRRDGAFTIMYVIQNVGALSPIVTGTIALVLGYNGAFSFCAILSALGALSLLVTDKKFFGPIGLEPDDPVEPSARNPFLMKLVVVVAAIVVVGGFCLASGVLSVTDLANYVSTIAIFVPIAYIVYIYRSHKTSNEERRRVLAWVPLFVSNCFTFLVWMQGTTVLSVYAETSVDRNFFGMEITPAAFQTVPGLAAIIWGLVMAAVWSKMGSRQPGSSMKMGIGSILWGLGPIFMCIPFVIFPAGVKVSPMWLIAFYFIIILGEAFTLPTGWSVSSKVAPLAFSTQMVTVWGLSQSTGSALNTIAVNFYQAGQEVPYFLVIGGLSVVIGVGLMALAKKLDRDMDDGLEQKGQAAA